MIFVVLAQLAISAFACDMALAPPAPVATEAPCHQDSTPGAPLCQRHCHDEAQSQSPASFVPPAFVPSFIAALPLLPAKAIDAGAPSPTLLHATSPPLAIANCCLRV